MLKSLNSFFLIILISVLLIFICELILWSLYSLTKSSKFDTIEGDRVHKIYHSLKYNNYPENPENYLKIAVFGGSSAEGTVEFNFSNVIKDDLEKIFGSNIFIKNYGESGNSFHKEQAEILKKTIPFYDMFVIYSGHNEWVNLYNEDCGIKAFNINVKSCKEIDKKRNKKVSLATEELYKKNIRKFNLFKFLESKSRIYSIISKTEYYLSNYLSKKNIKNTKSKNGSMFQETGLIRPAISEPNKAFSDKRIEKIPQRFEADLKEIIETLQKDKKFLILVGTVGNELFPPYFSKYSGASSINEVTLLNNKIHNVENNMKNKNFQLAKKQVKEILIEEPKHSYANFLMGKIDMYSGKVESSWSYFEKAVDEDGFPHRSLSKINLISKNLAEKNKGKVEYIDFPKVVRKLLSDDPSNNSIFVDWVHPSSLGHIIIGNLTSCEIIKHIKFKSNEEEYLCSKTKENNNFETTYNYYKKKFKITSSNIIETKKAIYRWAILLSRISAHPEYFYKIAQENIKYYYPHYKSQKEQIVKYLVLSSFLEVAQGNNCNTVKDNMYKAFTTSSDIFYQTLNDPFPFPEKNINIKDFFRLSGLKVENLDFSENSNKLCVN